MKRKMAQALCRGLWHYLPTWQVLWSLDRAVPHLSIFLTVTSAHIVNENVQDCLLWRSLDRTQIKHGIFTKSVLCSCKKNNEQLFRTDVQRHLGCPVKQRKQHAKLNTTWAAFLCNKMRRMGNSIFCSICVCKKTCWKGKYANKPKVVQRVGSERG